MSDLPNGITRQVHVEQSLKRAADAIAHVQVALLTRLTPTQRDTLNRKLAGAIGDCESVRLWLHAGAPR